MLNKTQSWAGDQSTRIALEYQLPPEVELDLSSKKLITRAQIFQKFGRTCLMATTSYHC